MNDVDLVIPVHNEAESIEGLLKEFDDALNSESSPVRVRFVVCEDGSRDGTPDVLRGLQASFPLELITSTERKGYSRAVLDGLRRCSAEIVAFVDGDGQYVPSDLLSLIAALEEGDLAVGYRSPRHDHAVRKLMSGAFRFVYRRLFPVNLTDPSSPYGAIRRADLAAVLDGFDEVSLPAGFWWEFYARARHAGLRVVERPISHRARSAGTTQVYRPTKVPGIAAVHLRGLATLRRELTRGPART